MDWRQATALTAKRRLDIWASEVESNNVLKAEFQKDRNAFVRSFVDTAIVDALADDLNTSSALTTLIAAGKKLEGLNRAELSDDDIELTQRQLVAGCYLVGIDLFKYLSNGAQRSFSLADYAKKLTSLRETAMQSKDFSGLDALKSVLVEAGAEVRMSKSGIEVVPGPNFDSSKLDALK